MSFSMPSNCGQKLTAMPLLAWGHHDEHANTATLTGERADLLTMLGKARHFLRFTTRDLTEEQARQRTTVSELTLGGLIKHVTAVERNWPPSSCTARRSRPTSHMTEADYAEWANGFRLLPGETLAGALAEYEEVPKQTDELVAALPDLDASHPLPAAPWMSRPASAGRPAAPCCTSPPRPPSTRATPTSSARPSTARRRWASSRPSPRPAWPARG